MGELFQESMKLVTRRGWCHCVTMHTATTPQSPLFIRNVSRLHTTIYTTFQTYNYHLQINLTLAPRFLINYLMRRINGHREISPKLHWDPGARLRLQRPIKSGLNARRDSALHWVNVSLFHRRCFLSGGRCLPWYFSSQLWSSDSRQQRYMQRGDRGYKELLSQVSGQNDKYVVSMLSSVVAICCFELSLRNKIIKAAENICCCAVPTISGLCCINDL